MCVCAEQLFSMPFKPSAMRWRPLIPTHVELVASQGQHAVDPRVELLAEAGEEDVAPAEEELQVHDDRLGIDNGPLVVIHDLTPAAAQHVHALVHLVRQRDEALCTACGLGRGERVIGWVIVGWADFALTQIICNSLTA